ncbi:MAG: TMEM175 family protein [Chitinophagaceae bacterium]
MEHDRPKLHMASLRLETLGDGIFAIAMTILVLELHLPEVHGNSWSDFQHAIQKTWIGLMCYVISFVLMGIMWFGHRMMFEYIGKCNRHFIFLGVLFYMVVCLVPFSTRFLAENALRWYTIMAYGVNLILCNLTLYAQWIYGINRPSLLHREVPVEMKREADISFLGSPIIYVIAIGLSFFVPMVSIALFIITPLLYLIPNKIDKYLP